jgi:hypothetical protein
MRGALNAIQLIMDLRKQLYPGGKAWTTLTHAAQSLIKEFDERGGNKKSLAVTPGPQAVSSRVGRNRNEE